MKHLADQIRQAGLKLQKLAVSTKSPKEAEKDLLSYLSDCLSRTSQTENTQEMVEKVVSAFEESLKQPADFREMVRMDSRFLSGFESGLKECLEKLPLGNSSHIEHPATDMRDALSRKPALETLMEQLTDKYSDELAESLYLAYIAGMYEVVDEFCKHYHMPEYADAY